MRIAEDLRPLGLGRRFGRPNLGPAEKEPLLRRKAVDQVRTFTRCESILERGVRNIQSAEVADILAEGQLSVDLEAGLHFVAVELPHDTVCALLEFLPVLRSLPRSEVALGS